MAGNGKTMRLVTDALNEARGRPVRLGYQRALEPVDEKTLLPGASFGSLGDTDQRQVRKAQPGEHLVHARDLPHAAIDQQHIRGWHLPVAHVAVASLERLAQRAVVIP